MSIADRLKSNMFTKENLDKYMTHLFSNDDEIKNSPILSSLKNPILESNIYNIAENDKFFWCFYIINYGMSQYEQVYNKFVEEKKIKIEMVEEIRKHKDILKQNKWKKNDIESELTNDEEITVKTFICLLTIFKHNFTIKNNFLLYDKINNEDSSIFHLIYFDKKDISIYSGDDKVGKIMEYREKCWNIDDYNKPLKAISKYKLKDLQTIAIKMDIDIIKKKKKDLYLLILEKI